MRDSEGKNCRGKAEGDPPAHRGPVLSGRVLLLLLAVLLVLVAVYFFHQHQSRALYLVVEVPREGEAAETLFRQRVKTGEIFELEYTHSVTQRLVWGSFEITAAKKIKPLTTRFDTFGPGLPYLDGSLDYIVENGLYIVFHDEAPRENIRMFVSPLTGERLLLEDDQILDLGGLRDGPFLVHIFVGGTGGTP